MYNDTQISILHNRKYSFSVRETKISSIYLFNKITSR